MTEIMPNLHRRMQVLFLGALLLAFALPSSAIADQEGYIGSYDVPVHGAPNLKFVMLNHNDGTPEYTRSGLYRRGEPNQPLWTVDWWAPRVGLFAEGDDVYLVRFPIWNRGGPAPDEFALAFYKNGQLLREYHVGELNPTHFKRSISHFMWNDGCELDTATGIVTLDTYNNKRYRFDARTGEIIEVEEHESTQQINPYGFEPRPETTGEKVWRWIWGDPEMRAGVGAALGLTGLLVWLVWRRRKVAARRVYAVGNEQTRPSNQGVTHGEEGAPHLMQPKTRREKVIYAIAAVPALFLPFSYIYVIGWFLVSISMGLPDYSKDPNTIANILFYWIGYGGIYGTFIQWPIYILWAISSRQLTVRVRVLWISLLVIGNMFAIPYFLYCMYRGTAQTALIRGIRQESIRCFFEKRSGQWAGTKGVKESE